MIYSEWLERIRKNTEEIHSNINKRMIITPDKIEFVKDNEPIWSYNNKPGILIGTRGNGKSLTSLRNYLENDIERTVNYFWHRPKPNDKIKKVIFSNPVTVVLWSDGTKTIVRCNGEEFDPEKGLAMAIAKKYLGTNSSQSNYYDVFSKWIKDYETSYTLDSLVDIVKTAFIKPEKKNRKGE